MLLLPLILFRSISAANIRDYQSPYFLELHEIGFGETVEWDLFINEAGEPQEQGGGAALAQPG